MWNREFGITNLANTKEKNKLTQMVSKMKYLYHCFGIYLSLYFD